MAIVQKSVFWGTVLLATLTRAAPDAFGSQVQSIQSPGPQGVKPKQTIQQFQVAVVLPPGSKPHQGNQPPSGPPSSEFVWLQVPASYFTSQAPPPYRPEVPYEPQRPVPEPDQFKPIRPIYNPPVQEAPASPPYVPLVTSPPYAPAVQQPVPSTTTQGTPVEVLLRKCQTPRGQFPSDICNKYVNCWDGFAVEQFCPEGLLFHSKGYCDYAYNVDCKGRPIQAIPPPPTPLVDTTIVPPGQVSSSQAPTQVSSSSQAPTTAAPPTVIVTIPTIDPSLRKRCLKPRGQFRSKECHKYVNCWDDVVIEQECPEGLLFSNKGYCDYPANVDCKNATVPPRSGVPSGSECPLEFGTFRNKEKCSNYYTCIAGQVVARYDCPEGFNFNDNLGVCDYAERVDCSKEPQIYFPKANLLSNVQKDFMEKISDCKPGAVFALNPQCTAACLCHESGSEIVQCPSGLAYDSPTDKCILPHLAKC